MAETTAAPSGAHSRSGSVYASKFKLPEHFYGGNSLDAAAPSKVKDFVAANDGHTVITKVGSAFQSSPVGRNPSPHCPATATLNYP